jgi:hypothetical protein
MAQERVAKFVWVDGKGHVNNVDTTLIDTHVANYLHQQMTPSTKWTINHNLGRYPSVSVIDSAGNVVYGDVKHLSLNSVQIEFAHAFGGKATFN